MVRAPKTQMSFYIALILVAIGAVSAIPLLSAAIAEGRSLTAFEDILLDLLIGCFVFAGPVGLMLWLNGAGEMNISKRSTKKKGSWIPRSIT
jgi:hypothetical protein